MKVDVDTTKTNREVVNSSPKTLMFPIVRIQNNCNSVIKIPGECLSFTVS